MSPAEMLTEAKRIHDGLAKQGILAIYGGGTGRRDKGHGFWLYRSSPESIARYEAARGWASLDDVGPCILNDGTASGNPAFHMAADAAKFLEDKARGLRD